MIKLGSKIGFNSENPNYELKACLKQYFKVKKPTKQKNFASNQATKAPTPK